LAGSPAFAQSGIDAQENLFGATNVGAIVGHGGLSAAVSETGDITVLSWPNPSTNDQLGYVSSNALDARQQPRFGAPEGAGVVLGLQLHSGDATEIRWLREADAVTQGFDTWDRAVPETVFTWSDGLTVTLLDAIDPDRDVLARIVSVDESPAGVEAVDLLSYANLSPIPLDSRIPELPFVDWAFDGRNDFAAVWDPARQRVVHFHPEGNRVYDDLLDAVFAPSADWGPIGDALAAGTPDGAALSDTLSGYGPGAYAAIATVPAPSQHQVGYDTTDWCGLADALIANFVALPTVFEGFNLPIDPSVLDNLRCPADFEPVHVDEGWVHDATDPWVDLADGALEGSDAAAGEVSSALVTPMAVEAGAYTATLYIGFGPDDAAAHTAVDDAIAAGDVDGRCDAAVAEWIAPLVIPGEVGSGTHTLSARALINMRVGTDRETGALVASLARQPPYNSDWPRDGAFFNIALDASGQSELVAKRLDLYVDWQRSEPVEPTPLIDPEPPEDPDFGNTGTYPADAWEMNYTPDGEPGGNLRFEIDTTAFAVWTMIAHVGWADDPEGALRSRWDSIERGCDLLARWKDPENDLHAPAQEDDAVPYTQTLHGAITVFGTLEQASRAARMIGEDDAAQRWEARAIELRQAIIDEMWNEEEGRFVQEATFRGPFAASGRVPTGPSAWAIWPMRILTWDDPWVPRQIEFDRAIIELNLDGESGGSYFMKNTNSQGVAEHRVPELAGINDTVLERLVALSTEGTYHFGEAMVLTDDGVSQRTANPHLWQGALFYLTALAIEEPGSIEAYEDVLPESRVILPRALPEEEDEKGCGCMTSGASGLGALVLAGLLALASRRRAGR
jgi:hypothetical protein